MPALSIRIPKRNMSIPALATMTLFRTSQKIRFGKPQYSDIWLYTASITTKNSANAIIKPSIFKS